MNITVKKRVGLYIAGFLIIAAAMLLVILITLAEVGCIHPRKIQLRVFTEDISKVYDGTPLIGEALLFDYGEPLEGHTVTILSKSSITDVGEAENKVEFMITDTTGADVTEQYDLKVEFGKLSVTPRKIQVDFASKRKTYDGQPLSSSEWEITGRYKLVSGHTLDAVCLASITEVGSVENSADISIYNASGADVTSQYELEVSPGKLTVEPRLITITTDSAQKQYDGLPLFANGWDITSGSVASGHQMEVVLGDSIVEVGKKYNEAEILIKDEKGIDVTDQYKVVLKKGALEVLGRPLYITIDGGEKIYDGQPLSCSNWMITSGELAMGERISMISSAQQTEVGKTENSMQFVIYDNSGKDVTSRYDLIFKRGILTVKPRKITVQIGSATKTFDGKAFSDNSWTIQEGELCSGHQLTIVGTSKTDVGIYDNTVISYAIYDMSSGRKIDVTDCYQFTYNSGTLTILPNS